MPSVLLTVLAVFMACCCIFPFLFMLSSSFKPQGQVFEYPIRLIPQHPILSNYRTLFSRDQMFGQWYANTILMTLLTLLIKTFIICITAYAFAKLNFKGKNFIFIIFLSALMIPGDVTLVQRYVVYKHLHLTNTMWALILPASFDMYFVFMMRQFFMGIPNALTEVAIIDGCSHFKIFYKIMLPLAKPAILTMILFSFVWQWNDYTNPYIFITDTSKQMLTVGLTMFQISQVNNYAVQMAGATLALLPIIVAYLFLQKYFVEGIATSGMKG
jgi:multiple sugar transport system permease protein